MSRDDLRYVLKYGRGRYQHGAWWYTAHDTAASRLGRWVWRRERGVIAKALERVAALAGWVARRCPRDWGLQ